MMKRTWLAGVLGLAVIACGGPAPEAEERVLHRGNELEPLTLDPHVAYITGERQIVNDLFVGLYQPDPAGRPVFALAEAAETSPDGLSWTFTLREAVWSDGQPITATDVVTGLRRAVDPATRNPYPTTLLVLENAQAISEGGAPVDTLGVEAVDDRTVVMRLEHPAPYLPSVFSVWGQPVPTHVIEAHGDAWVQPDNIVVSGAFDLVRWRSNDVIELQRNARFYDADQVCLDRVFYYPTVDTNAAERRVRNGELDLNTEFTGANLPLLRERHPELVDIGLGLVVRSISFNTASQIGGDVRVRTALGMAIDRRFIAEEVLAGADIPAARYVPEGVTGRIDGPRIAYIDTPMDQRRQTARDLLVEAGYGPDNPLSITLFYQPAAGWPRVAPVVQQDWALIADWVEVEIAVRDSQLHYDAMRAGDYVAATSGWVGDFDDPYAYLLQFGADAGDINFSRWSDPAYEAVLRMALMNPDTAERSRQLAEAESLFLAAGPETPIFVESNKNLVSPRVEGWQSSPWQINPSRWLCVE
jgi:oligopeptide transport system substrate-binding protein